MPRGFSPDGHSAHHRGGRRRGMGRPRIIPNAVHNWGNVCGKTQIELTATELDIIKLTDIDHKTQAEVAALLNVSRATVWRILQSAREKIAAALISATMIHVLITTTDE